jgi:hypothetical protein
MAAEALKISSEADNVQVPVNEIEVNEIDGMQPIPNQSSTLSLSVSCV